MSSILLSICIPTYNRSYVLKNLINSIVSQKEFNKYVELVISDNCSDDDTFEVVQSFQKGFSNIKYTRNEKNIGPTKNIFNVLCLGEGKFLKLVNDYSYFNAGSLKQIIDVITNYESDHSVIFFSNMRFKIEEEITECLCFDEFVSNVSYPITYMLYFGIWKTELDLLMKGKFIDYNFPHLDLLLRNLELGYKPIIFNGLIITNQTLSKQGNYNIFETFIQNYLTLLGRHIGKNQISISTFKKEKKKLLYGFVYPWYCSTVIDKSESYSFSTERFTYYLIKYFSISDILIFTYKVQKYRMRRYLFLLFKKIIPKWFISFIKKSPIIKY